MQRIAAGFAAAGMYPGPVMTAGEEYRFYARECRRWAQDARDERQRQLFLDMARTWRQLALSKDGRTDDGDHPLTHIRPGK